VPDVEALMEHLVRYKMGLEDLPAPNDGRRAACPGRPPPSDARPGAVHARRRVQSSQLGGFRHASMRGPTQIVAFLTRYARMVHQYGALPALRLLSAPRLADRSPGARMRESIARR
jgi:hypothetical protein